MGPEEHPKESERVVFYDLVFPTLGIHAKNMVLYHYPLVICYIAMENHHAINR